MLRVINLTWLLILAAYYFDLKFFDVPFEYLIIPFASLFLATSYPRILLNSTFILVLLVSAYLFVVSIFSEACTSFVYCFDFPLKFFIWGTFATLSAQFFRSQHHRLRLLVIFLYSNAASCLISLISMLLADKSIFTRFDYFLLKPTLNSNYVGLQLIFCLLILFSFDHELASSIIPKNRIRKLLLFIVSLPLLLTISRSAYVSVVATIVLPSILSILKKVKFSFFAVFTLLLVSSILLYFYLSDSFFSSQLFRFVDIDNLSRLGGRSPFFQAALSSISDQPIFGNGSYGLRYISDDPMLSMQMIHNTFLEILVGYGIIGFLLILSVVLFPYFKIILSRAITPDWRYFVLRASLCFFIYANTLNIETERSFWLFLTILFSLLLNNKKTISQSL